LIDQCQFTLGQIKQRVSKQKSLKVELSAGGKLYFDHMILSQKATFLDYITRGCQIGVEVAIDFTASNGELHKLGGRVQTNHYTDAITSVCEILQEYDSDMLFPVYGFGGQAKRHKDTHHCFALNGNDNKPEVKGAEGVL